MDDIKELIAAEVENFCLTLEQKFKKKNLYTLWLNRSNDRTGDCVMIDEEKFLNCKHGIFGKMVLNDVQTLSDEDELLCNKHGYKVMKGPVL